MKNEKKLETKENDTERFVTLVRVGKKPVKVVARKSVGGRTIGTSKNCRPYVLVEVVER